VGSAVNALELRVPPPLWTLLFALAMAALAWLTPTYPLGDAVRFGLAGVLALVGLGVSAAGIVEFRRARTTIHPLQPHKATVLVDSGIYRRTRNPMYLGLLLVLVAWGLGLASAWAMLGPVGFVLVITRLQIGPEERALTALFGAQYARYRARVRRWI